MAEVGERLDLCGTMRGYNKHVKERTESCEPCKAANRAKGRAYRELRAKKQADTIRVNVIATASVTVKGAWVITLVRKGNRGRATARNFAEIEPASRWLIKELFSSYGGPVVIGSINIKYPKEK